MAIKETRIWNSKDEMENTQLGIRWKYVPQYTWTFDKGDFDDNEERFPSANVIFDDWLVSKVWIAEMTAQERMRRWDFNFISKGQINHNLLGTGRACKQEFQGIYYYGHTWF